MNTRVCGSDDSTDTPLPLSLNLWVPTDLVIASLHLYIYILRLFGASHSTLLLLVPMTSTTEDI